MLIKKIIIVVNFLLYIPLIGSLEIKSYKPVRLFQIPKGFENGQIEIEKNRIKLGGTPGPLSFTIYENNILIPDIINKRIAIFDFKGNFIKNIITENKYIIPAGHKIIIDNNKSIIFLQDDKIFKIDQNGSIIFN